MKHFPAVLFILATALTASAWSAPALDANFEEPNCAPDCPTSPSPVSGGTSCPGFSDNNDSGHFFYDDAGDYNLDLVLTHDHRVETANVNVAGRANFRLYEDNSVYEIPASETAARALDSGDVDGDGDSDVLFQEDNSRVYALLNDGAGEFPSRATVTTTSVSSANKPHYFQAKLADLDGDGRKDAVHVQTIRTVTFNLNTSSGSASFGSDQSLYSGGLDDVVYGFEVRDFDADGDQDVLVSAACTGLLCGVTPAETLSATNVIAYENDGEGSFMASVLYSSSLVDGARKAITSLDEFGDGLIDVGLASHKEGPKSNITLLRNNEGTLDSGDWTASNYNADLTGIRQGSSAASGDLDGDGDDDLVVALDDSDDRTKSLMVFTTDATQSASQLVPLQYVSDYNQVARVKVFDLDEDERMDIIAIGAQAAIHVLQNNGDSNILTWPQYVAACVTCRYTDAVFADFDGDGYIDIITTGGDLNSSSADKNIYLLKGNYSKNTRIDIGNDANIEWRIAGENRGVNQSFNNKFSDGVGDRNLSFSAGGSQDLNVQIARDWNADVRIARVTLKEKPVTWTSSTNGSNALIALRLFNYDREGWTDFAGMRSSSSDTQALLYVNDGDNTWTEQGFTVGIANAQDIEVGDIDRDGNEEIIIAGDSEVVVVSESLSVTQTIIPASLGVVRGIELLDYDNDGDLDLAVASPDSVSPVVIVYFNDGAGTFALLSNACALSSGNLITQLKAGDIDRDGKTDLIIGSGNTSGEVAINACENTGLLGSNTSEIASFSDSSHAVKELEFEDLDGDGRKDLLVTLRGHPSTPSSGSDANVYAFRNLNSTGVDSFGTRQTLGEAGFQSSGTDRYGSRIAVADSDNDADLDLFAGGVLFENNSFADSWTRRVLGLDYNAVASADSDNDGDFDFMTGAGLKLWKNTMAHGVSLDVGVDGNNDIELDYDFLEDTVAGSVSAQGMTAADLDKDGENELLYAATGLDLHALKKKPDGSWEDFTLYNELSNSVFGNVRIPIRVDDLDNDGNPDIVFNDITTQTGHGIIILYGDGSLPGTWSSTKISNYLADGTLPCTIGEVTAIEIVDYDNDGKKDIAFSTKNHANNIGGRLDDPTVGTRRGTVHLLVNDDPTLRSWLENYAYRSCTGSATCNFMSLSTGDFLNEGRKGDIVAGDSLGKVYYLKASEAYDMNTDCATVTQGTSTKSPSTKAINYIASGDLDRSGRLDVAFADANSKVYHYLNNGAFTGWSLVQESSGAEACAFAAGQNPISRLYKLAVTDLDNNGTNDLVATCSDRNVYAWINEDGEADANSFTKTQLFQVPGSIFDYPMDFALTDLDSDGRTDLAIQRRAGTVMSYAHENPSLVDAFNSYIETCTADSNGVCAVPFRFHSASSGGLSVSDLLVVADQEIPDFGPFIESYLRTNCSGAPYTGDENCAVPVRVVSESSSPAGLVSLVDLNVTGWACDPPASGDWNLDENEDILCEDRTIDLSGSLNVSNSSSLEMNRVDLDFSQAADYDHALDVFESGRLDVNDSNFNGNGFDFYYYFQDNAQVDFDNSDLAGTGNFDTGGSDTWAARGMRAGQATTGGVSNDSSSLDVNFSSSTFSGWLWNASGTSTSNINNSDVSLTLSGTADVNFQVDSLDDWDLNDSTITSLTVPASTTASIRGFVDLNNATVSWASGSLVTRHYPLRAVNLDGDGLNTITVDVNDGNSVTWSNETDNLGYALDDNEAHFSQQYNETNYSTLSFEARAYKGTTSSLWEDLNFFTATALELDMDLQGQFVVDCGGDETLTLVGGSASVDLDSSNSDDLVGDLIARSWDCEDDGVVDGTSTTINCVYTTAGEKKVMLKLDSDIGATSGFRQCATVTVNASGDVGQGAVPAPGFTTETALLALGLALAFSLFARLRKK